MKLYLIRHGESKGNVDRGYIAGRTDPNGLTPRGKAQIIRTAWELRNTEFSAIYSSPVVRAVESATIIGDLLNKKVHQTDFLAEMSYGDFEGTYFWDDMDKKRKAFERWNTEISYAFPNGESLEMVSERVWKGFNEWKTTVDTRSKQNIIFTSHDAIVSVLLFSLIYGHPTHKDATASYKKAFMQFVHSIEVANGSIFIVDLHANPVTFHKVQPPQRYVGLTEESITFYLRGLHQGKSLQIEEKITASDNKVYHVANEADTIVKFIREREIVSSERIVSIYKYLKKNTSIPAPHVELYDKSQAFFEDTVLLQDYQAGEDQNEYFGVHDEFNLGLIRATFAMLGDIHAIPANAVEEFWYPDDAWHKVHIPWHMYISEEIDMTLKKLPRALPDPACRKEVRLELKKLREYVLSQQTQLVPLHGDYAPQNIIVYNEGSLRIIDFERARIGDPLWDYAYYYGWLQRKFAPTAAKWREHVESYFSQEEVERFESFTILFHAWTVRDILQYRTNTIRARRANKSREILEKWARHRAKNMAI